MIIGSVIGLLLYKLVRFAGLFLACGALLNSDNAEIFVCFR